MKTARLIAPWVIGLALLGVLLARVDVVETGAALQRCDLGFYLGVAFGFIGLWWLLDSLVVAFLVSRSSGPVRVATVALARAATYPWMIANFHLASAALVASLARDLHLPMARVAGSMLVYYLLDLVALTALAFAGSLVLEGQSLGYLRLPLGLLLVGGLSALFGARIVSRWLGERALFAALRELPRRRLAVALGGRLALHASFAAFMVLGALAFDIEIPWTSAVQRTPLILAIGALPISVGSLGTAQAAILFFFGEYAREEALLAFGIAYSFTSLVLRVPVGLAAIGIRRGRRCRPAESLV